MTPPPACAIRSTAPRRGGCRHSFAPVLLVHEDAGDPVVGVPVESGLVLLAVMDVRQVLRGAVVGPDDIPRHAHQLRSPSTSPRGSSPRLGAPTTRISRPSGPAS